MAGSKTIGLLAIVKDEEKSIEAMLKSCLDARINKWCIQDTGSTDKTRHIILDLFRNSDTQLLLTEEKWKDFSTNRNLNIEQAFSHFDQVDYWLALDADETVEAHGELQLPGELGMYHIPEKMMNEDPQIVFQAPRLIKGGSDFRYRGRCHEVLCSPSVQPVGLASGWHLYHWDTGRYSQMGDHARLGRNLELLRQDLKDPKCDKARTIFYLGMTLERGGHSSSAIEEFSKRSKMTGTWEEERWMAHYRMACCQLRLGRVEGVDTMLRCMAERPWRAEPLLDVAAFYHGLGLDQLANMFLPQGPFPYPVNDTLFLREDLYQPNPLTNGAVSACP